MGFFAGRARTYRFLRRRHLTWVWITQLTHRDQRRFLEKHMQLLTPGTERILRMLLAVLDDQPDVFQQITQISEEHLMQAFRRWKLYSWMLSDDLEIRAEVRQDCEESLKILEEIHAGGDTKEAIRTVYLKHFGWSVLDMPRPLEQAVVRILIAQQLVQMTAREEALVWEQLLQAARNDKKVFPEVITALQSLKDTPVGTIESISLTIPFLEKVITRISAESRALERAKIQVALGSLYSQRGLIKGQNEDLQQAISYYTVAEPVLKPHPQEWARLQLEFAATYQHLRGDEATNIEQAIAASEAALHVFTRNESPEQWARAQALLGALYTHRKTSTRAENNAQAFHHLRAALQVYTEDEYQHEWAGAQLALSHLYAGFSFREKSDTIEEAIRRDEQVLKAYAEDNLAHTMVKLDLASLYSDRLWGKKDENQQKALDLAQQAIAKLSRSIYPLYWAVAQRILGSIYRDHRAGNRAENMERAVACYEAALALSPLEAFPGDHHITQLLIADIRGQQENWQKAHDAYVRVRKAEDQLMRMGAGLAGKHVTLGSGKEGRDSGIRDGFALIKLGRLEEGVIAIERGQARMLAASLAMDAADSMEISNVERRQQFIQAQRVYIQAQTALNEPLPDKLSENERRLKDIERRKRFHGAEDALEAIIQEVRAARDPEQFLDDTPTMETIFQAAACGGPGHALIYLLETPWGGMAVAVFNANPEQGIQRRVAAFDLPSFHDDLLGNLMAIGKPVIGGFKYAQEYLGFRLLVNDWTGVSFQGHAEHLHATCFLEDKTGMLDQAAQNVLAKAQGKPFLTQPLKVLATEKGEALETLMDMMNSRFLELELKRAWEAFSQAGIPDLIRWLVKQKASSLTIIPCGWLATFPIVATPCGDDGQTVGDLLPTSVAPNARSLLQQREAGQQERSGIYALGNPSPTHPPLEWGEAEALTIYNLARRQGKAGGVKIQEQATREWLISALQQGLVVEISSHGHFDSDDFLCSALLLAKGKQLTLGEILSHHPYDNKPTLSDTRKLNRYLNLRGLRLLILSACQTASADMEGAAANEVKSLAVGMLQAGASAVLASLWPVDDKASYVLIVRFMQEWLSLGIESTPPAKALARAQEWMRRIQNRELQQWLVNELPAITQVDRQEAGSTTLGAKPATSLSPTKRLSEEESLLAEDRHMPAKEDSSSVADREAQEEELAPTPTTRVGRRERSYRYNMGEAQKILHDELKEGDPDVRPYADPIYWAGFQVTGW